MNNSFGRFIGAAVSIALYLSFSGLMTPGYQITDAIIAFTGGFEAVAYASLWMPILAYLLVSAIVNKLFEGMYTEEKGQIADDRAPTTSPSNQVDEAVKTYNRAGGIIRKQVDALEAQSSELKTVLYGQDVVVEKTGGASGAASARGPVMLSGGYYPQQYPHYMQPHPGYMQPHPGYMQPHPGYM